MSGRLIVVICLGSLAPAAFGATLYVPGQHATIQSAVFAAAPGDTIVVAAGTYQEQVVIGIDLVLRGAGVDQTIVTAPFSLPHAVGTDQYRAVICVNESADTVTVSDLTVDGLGRHPATGRFVGLLFYRAGGYMERLAVRNVHATPVSVATSGIGVLATLDQQPTATSVTIADVVVERFQKAGLVVSGAGMNVLITGVEVDPGAIYSDVVQNGIELTRVTSALVNDIAVRNVTYDGTPRPEFVAVGLLVNQCTSLELSDAVFEGCQAGSYLVRTPAMIRRVDVTSPSTLADPVYGIVSVGAINLDAANNGPDAIRAPRPLMSGATLEGRPPVVFEVRLRDCLLDGGLRPNARGLVARSLTAEAQSIAAERCRLLNWTEGTLGLEGGFGTLYSRYSGCRFAGNTAFGARFVTSTPLDARGCHWGDVSGPLHPTTNPAGLGDRVNDHVLYDPWLLGNLVPLPLPQAISLADWQGAAYVDTVTVEYLGGGGAPLYGFSAQLTWDTDVVRMVSVQRPSGGGFGEAVFFQALPTAAGVTVDAALGGGGPGIDSGPLLTIRFEAVGTPDWTLSPITLDLLQARDSENMPVAGLAIDHGAITVDLQPPTVSNIVITNTTLPHTDAFAKDGDLLAVSATISDADPYLSRGAVRGIGAFLWGAPAVIQPPDAYAGGVATWNARPALLTPANGDALFYIEVIDPSGNALSPLASAGLIADNTRPMAVTGVAAVSGHNQVALIWNDAAGSDLYYYQTIVRANRWLGYPFYDGAGPNYPASATAGAGVYAGTGTAVTPTYPADGSARDIYYYSVMAMDMAGNTSVPTAASRARATNYRLGDVRGQPSGSPGDGIVDLYDITRLGDTFGLLRGEPGFLGDCDVFPNDGDAAPIPDPDGAVDFDDLMIFAGQFDLDNPRREPATDLAVPSLRWQQVAPEAWALLLEAPCPQLKGLRLSGPAPHGTLRLEAGELLQIQPAPWFLHQGRGGFEAHLAVLGRGLGLVGAGELLRLVASGPVLLPVPTVDLRDLDNQPLPVQLPTAVVEPGDVPTVFRVGRPTPNPFNAATEIAFDLPAATRVTLAVYRPDGRVVRTLLDGPLPGGRHRAHWDGRDQAGRPVASGTYLYRLVATDRPVTGKLELVK